jgi:hypothetical protein
VPALSPFPALVQLHPIILWAARAFGTSLGGWNLVALHRMTPPPFHGCRAQPARKEFCSPSLIFLIQVGCDHTADSGMVDSSAASLSIRDDVCGGLISLELTAVTDGVTMVGLDDRTLL